VNILFPAFEQALLFLPLALAIYLSYGILRITDMTVDGSFVLGAAVCARLLTEGMPLSTAMLFAIAAGFMAGVGVSLIQAGGRIHSLIAGILALFILYSVNFQVMGRPNISLHDSSTLVSLLFPWGEYAIWWVIAGISVMLMLCMALFLKTRFGLLMRGFGQNAALFNQLGHSQEYCRTIGLGISNALAALCGALTAQVNGYADLNMGFGMVLTGIGAVVIGEQLLSRLSRQARFNVMIAMCSCLVGVVIYFLVLNLCLRIGIDPVNLKMVLGLMLIFFLRSAMGNAHGH